MSFNSPHDFMVAVRGHSFAGAGYHLVCSYMHNLFVDHHNITQSHNSDIILQKIPHNQSECEEYYVGLTMFCRKFLTFSLNVKILYRILSVPQNIVMAPNNVMMQTLQHKLNFYEQVACTGGTPL